jgi:hypothetical protein
MTREMFNAVISAYAAAERKGPGLQRVQRPGAAERLRKGASQGRHS